MSDHKAKDQPRAPIPPPPPRQPDDKLKGYIERGNKQKADRAGERKSK